MIRLKKWRRFPVMKPTTTTSLKELIPGYTIPEYILTQEQEDEMYARSEEIAVNTLRRIRAERAAEPEVTPPAPFGAENKIFTEERANKAREILRKKLGGIHMGVPLDPEIVQAGIELAGYYIEGGARSFSAYSKKMIEDLGDMIRPCLKSFYMAIKNYPGFDKTGMDTEAALDKIDVNAIDISNDDYRSKSSIEN